MSVREQRGLCALESGEQGQGRVARPQLDAGRRGGDEQAKHAVDAGNGGMPAGADGAEDDVAAMCEAREQHGPRTLQDGGKRQPVLPSHGFELPRLRQGERRVVLRLPARGIGRHGRRQARRALEAGELGAPRGPGRLFVLAGQPRQVGREGGRGWEPPRWVAVERGQVVKQNRAGPSVAE